MKRYIVPLPTPYPALSAVETLPVGSAKVPHLPYLEDVVLAQDEVAAQRAVVARAPLLDEFAGVLAGHGYESMAATVNSAIESATRNIEIIEGRRAQPAGLKPDKLNSALRSTLEWVYAATLKTAGHSTMEFAPWFLPRGEGHGRPGLGRDPRWGSHVTVSGVVCEQVAAANAVIYERAVGLTNEAHAAVPPQAGAQPVVDRVLASLSHGRTPRFDDPRDLKSVLKIDYKVGSDGLLYMVDLNAGTIGAWFDDDVMSHVSADLAPHEVLIADRQVEAVLDTYRAARGGLPARVAVSVLDERMFDLWCEADIEGLIGRLHAVAAARGGELARVPVITLAEMYDYAATRDDDPGRRRVLNDVAWPGRLDLVVAYSWGTTRADRAAYARLNEAGVMTIDGAQHSLLAAKELAIAELAPADELPGVVFPPTEQLGSVSEVLATGDVCEGAWRAACENAWPAVAIKMQKLRRKHGKGDFQSAYIYPATDVGRVIAGRLASVFREVEAAGGGDLLLTVSRVDLGGGLDDRDGLRRDVELRTYAFPVLP